jgi:hypothetical protein
MTASFHEGPFSGFHTDGTKPQLGQMVRMGTSGDRLPDKSEFGLRGL